MGIKVRTNNRDELYSENYASGKIFPVFNDILANDGLSRKDRFFIAYL